MKNKRPTWLRDVSASLKDVRETLSEINDLWGFGKPEGESDVHDDDFDYDRLAAGLETALDTIVDELSLRIGSTDVGGLTVDEILALHVARGLVDAAVVNVAARLVEALGSRSSHGDRTGELLEGPTYVELRRMVDALEKVARHVAEGGGDASEQG